MHIVCADKPPYFRVVVAYIQIIEACFDIIVIAPIAEGILSQNTVRINTLGSFSHTDRSAPEVVFVGADELGVTASVDGGDVSLKVSGVEVADLCGEYCVPFYFISAAFLSVSAIYKI